MWFLKNPDFESWRGYRILCWQIGWTVSRGGVRGLVPGLERRLAAEDQTERTIAALLIADAADYVRTFEPPFFGGGSGPPARPPVGAADPAALPQLLREAARAGVVQRPVHGLLPKEPHVVLPNRPAPDAAADANGIATELDVEAVRRAFRTVSISRDGIPVGHVKFALAVDPDAADPAAEPQGVDARRYRFAFVSYASQDRDEVLRRVQMLPVAGLDYFQDVLDLEPGEVWSSRLEEAIRDADVFLLFWPSRAKESGWVRKEVDFALACKAGDDLSLPEIRPVILEGPPVISPWDDLAHLHFNDRVLYFMSRPR